MAATGTPIMLAAAVLGVLSHLAFFNRGEHHMRGALYLQAGSLLSVSAVAGLVRLANYSVLDAASTVFPTLACFLAGLFTSTLVWRAFFSPLCKFPGPFGARLSNLWFSSRLARGDAPQQLLAMHEKYGPFLRIGSNDLSIAHPDGPGAIYGHGTKCTKAPWYDNDQPYTSMHTSRNRQMHDKRRRIWSPAFSDKALRGYEDRIRPYEDKLAEQLRAFGGKPVDATEWFNFFSFDVMGDLAFGEGFGCLDKGEEHWAIKLLNEGMEPLAMHRAFTCFLSCSRCSLLTFFVQCRPGSSAFWSPSPALPRTTGAL